jgi:dTDP-4-amino-4,6-dideoxygalactose transaminase
MMINVTKTYLPDFDTYTAVLKRAWDNGWVTNNGELLKELEDKLKKYLEAKHLFFTANGTIVLQMALKALGITKEVITTPFSYVATTNAILWEGCRPVFVDIDPSTFCIDANKIERAITKDTQAILATHVYGYPCNVEKIQKIADAHNLKVIYDGAHAFGCEYNGKSLLSYGDISTCSFHATKIFHTVEGGCIIASDNELARKLQLYRQFGHEYDDYISMGINAKNSELHAAMGLAIFPKLNHIIKSRKNITEQYNEGLAGRFQLPQPDAKLVYNYGYYPLVFESEAFLLEKIARLKERNIQGRRYFYPSLNQLPYLEGQPCQISEDISKRIFCLPLYVGLPADTIEKIIAVLNS